MRRALLPLACALLGCGARTALEASSSSTPDASPGGGADAAVGDAGAGDAPMDATGPCGDAGPIQLAYALDDVGNIWRYEPQSGRSQLLGAPSCANDNVQWTLTASSEKAFIVYTDWTIYEVSLATLACTPTPLNPAQLGIGGEFGVALAGSGASERLYVYGLTDTSETPVLAVADTSSFTLTMVGPVVPAPPPSTFPVNLTFDGAAHLVAYSPGGTVLVIDPATGALLQSVDSGVTSDSTWATLAYGPALYLWAASRVAGYDVASQSITGDHDAGINSVGAGSFIGCPP